MKLWLPNIRFGLTFLLFSAVVGGLYLGGTFNEQSIRDGYHALEIDRFYIRDAHSHGNFMSFYNLFTGLILGNLALSDTLKKIASYAAMAAVLLPVGLFITGLTSAPSPVGILGILGVTTSLGIMIYGAWRTTAS